MAEQELSLFPALAPPVTQEQDASGSMMSEPWKPKGAAFCWQPKAALRRIEQTLEMATAASAKLVYLALTRIASDEQKATFRMPITQIAHFASLNRRTVERRLPDLERLGLVVIQRSARRAEHMYHLATPSRTEPTPSRSDATAQGGLGCTPILINKCTIKEEKKNTTALGAVEIPAVLNTADFQDAWNDWVDHRLSFKKPKHPEKMFSRQLTWLAKFPVNTAVEILAQSTRNGWQGLFPQTNDKNSTRNRTENHRNAGIATDPTEYGKRIAEVIAKRQAANSTPVRNDVAA